ncbi:MAG: transcription antitermination factor NusB [Clostridia bacterium]|nr:transcription antitermination factor NusB [Clostridia bacterium]
MASITRRAARECALKALYSFDFNKDTDPVLYFALVCAEGEIPTNDFAATLFQGVVQHKSEIDEKITEHTKGWKIERVARVSLAILRLCAYELMFTDVPQPVALNEAVELAKLYGHDEAPSFVNGILNAIANDIGKNKA